MINLFAALSVAHQLTGLKNKRTMNIVSMIIMSLMMRVKMREDREGGGRWGGFNERTKGERRRKEEFNREMMRYNWQGSLKKTW